MLTLRVMIRNGGFREYLRFHLVGEHQQDLDRAAGSPAAVPGRGREGGNRGPGQLLFSFLCSVGMLA